MENFVEILLNPSILGALIVGACILLFGYIMKSYRTDKVDPNAPTSKVEIRADKRKEPQNVKQKKKAPEHRWTGRGKQQHFSHPWHLTSFKGHTGNVLDLDFSSNGKYLATCSDDRTVLLWDVKDIKNKDHKSIRINIEFDHPTFVRWSPDNKAFLINRYQDGNIEVYKVEKKKEGGLGHVTAAHKFPKVHQEEVVGMSIASNGKFILTCSSKNDLVLWDLKGQIMAKIDTCLMNTFCAKISPCGTLVLASGFSPDAKVWEVNFTKSGEFQEIRRAFELSGHTSGIYDVACNTDSSQMATVSKDGTWRLFDTKVEYRKGQDPHLLISGKYKNPSGEMALIALSHNGVLVIAVNSSLQFFSTFTGNLDHTIENIFTGNISRVLFEASGRYLLTSGPRHVLVFHNVTGYKCDIFVAQQKLKEHQTSATRERLQQIIKDSQSFLDTLSI